MIEGLKVNVSGVELKSLCVGRSDALLSKATAAREQAGTLREHGIGATANNSGGDPAEALEKKADEYAASAEELRFIAGHLVEAETYQLERDDLMRIGVIRSRW